MSYVVFSVENADRLVLMGPPVVAGQPTLKPIALSYIQAPKLSRRTISGEFGPEDPCAYEAAELIRSTFIGKQVRFTEDHYIDPLKRSAGRLVLANTETDAAVMLLKAGLATVPDRCPANMDKTQFELFTQVMKMAQAKKKGLFSPDAKKQVRRLVNLSPEQLAKAVERVLGKEILVRIERLLSATSLIVSCKELGETQVPVHLTGITSRDADCEEFAATARFFVERFLLNRNVTLHFDGTDSFGNVLGSVMSAKGAFQEELLAKGFVKLQNSTLTQAPRLAEMQAAEKDAMEHRRGAWKNYVPEEETKVVVTTTGSTTAPAADGTTVTSAAPVPHGIPTFNTDGTTGAYYTGMVEFTGTTVQILHGDTIVVREETTSQHIRLSLAGVRSSKNITRNQDGGAPEARVTYNDYAWEAREYLRQHYLGQKVSVKVEYARVMQETKEIRPACTVTVPETGANLGAAVLEKGFANFFLGKNDTCTTAAALHDAEEIAKTSQVGVHSPKECVPTTVVELSRLGEARGRYYLSFLQRGIQGSRPPVLKGVVDIVLGPTSFRVYVPKEHFQIPVKLAGIIAPQTAMSSTEKSDPFAEEAKSYAILLAQQREVSLQVYTSDRGGNFISSVILQDGTNVSVAMVEAGLATVGNADRLPFAQQLLDAESAAREAKKCIWSPEGAIPQRAAKMEQERAAANPHALVRAHDESSLQFKEYMLTEVAEDGQTVFLQEYGTEVDETKGKIQSLVNKTVASGEYVPKKGELVVAQYKADKTWCRAKIVHAKKGEDTVEAQFIDYGNVEVVSIKDVRYIPKGPEYAVVRDTKPMVFSARLAFLRTKLPDGSHVDAAVEAVYEYTDGEVIAKVAYKDGAGNEYYTVTVDENVPSLSETLLQKGLAVLDKRAATVDSEQYKRHEAAQEIARKGRKGLWQYGDIDDEDDEDL